MSTLSGEVVVIGVAHFSRILIPLFDEKSCWFPFRVYSSDKGEGFSECLPIKDEFRVPLLQNLTRGRVSELTAVHFLLNAFACPT